MDSMTFRGLPRLPKTQMIGCKRVGDQAGQGTVPSLFRLPILLPEPTGWETFLLWIPPRSTPHSLVTLPPYLLSTRTV